MSKDDSKDNHYKYNINGPINCVRVKKNYNGIQKILYLFFDIPLSSKELTECVDEPNLDVHKAFDKFFKKAKNNKIIYDFFLEQAPDNILKTEHNYKYKYNYLRQLHNYFNKKISFNEKQNKLTSKDANVRYHYIDIRMIYYLKLLITDNVNKFLHITDITNISTYHVHDVTESINYIFNYATIFFNQLCPDTTAPKVTSIQNLEYVNHENTEKMKQIIKFLTSKIKSKYENLDIKNTITSIIKNNITSSYNELRVLYKQFLLEQTKMLDLLNINLDTYYRNPSNEQGTYGAPYSEIQYQLSSIKKKITEFTLKNQMFCGQVMDLYFIRRFLDKNYISNGIIYVEASHCINIIRILITYFDFEVTHASYSQETNMEKLNNIIKNGTVGDMYDQFYPEKLHQCINLNGFPKNFL